MSEPYKGVLLKQRLLVGLLGERAQFGWWLTSFYEATSRSFLDPVFPKTSRLAQYHGTLEAARKVHDEHLSVGSYHLFRLPEELEQDLHSLMLSEVGLAMASTLLDSRSALDALAQIAGDGRTLSEGPTVVGDIKEIDSPAVVKAIAGTYLSAFQQNTRSYPYLVS